MPKTATDYSKTVIYKIVCNDLNVTDVYVGHTTNFRNRKNHHKSSCSNENSKDYNLKVYQVIRENSGWGNWSMIEIEKYPCNDGNEARKKERYWFEILNANMNSVVPSRTSNEYIYTNRENRKEYLEKNKEKINKQRRVYNEEHKEELKEKSRTYREEHREEMKEKLRKYQDEHREELNEKKRAFYQKHREEISKKNKAYCDEHREEINERRRKRRKILSLQI
jgi:hypothetical protein